MEKEYCNQIKEEVYKCSKCGLCQSVCPIYIATKNEMYLPRGKCSVLIDKLNNSTKFNKSFLNKIDFCLNCNLCERFCPSSIDMCKINNLLKSQNHFLNFSMLFKMYLGLFCIVKFLYKINPFKSFFLNTFLDELFNVKVLRKKYFNDNPKGSVIFFEGCINKYINPSDKNACLNLIEEFGFNVKSVISNCCGAPFLSDGNLENFNRNALLILNKISEDCDYIVCSCDSCYETLSKINNKFLKSKLITFSEFVVKNGMEIKFQPCEFYHLPIFRKENKFLPKSVILNKKGSCSFMENFLLLKHPIAINKLFKINFYDKTDLDDKTIVSTCLRSITGLKYGKHKIKSNSNILSLSEFLYYKRKNKFDEK